MHWQVAFQANRSHITILYVLRKSWPGDASVNMRWQQHHKCPLGVQNVLTIVLETNHTLSESPCHDTIISKLLLYSMLLCSFHVCNLCLLSLLLLLQLHHLKSIFLSQHLGTADLTQLSSKMLSCSLVNENCQHDRQSLCRFESCKLFSTTNIQISLTIACLHPQALQPV